MVNGRISCIVFESLKVPREMCESVAAFSPQLNETDFNIEIIEKKIACNFFVCGNESH